VIGKPNTATQTKVPAEESQTLKHGGTEAAEEKYLKVITEAKLRRVA